MFQAFEWAVYLGKSQTLLPPEEGPGALQQRLDLLLHNLHQLSTELLFFLSLRLQDGVQQPIDLPNKGVHKERNPRSLQRTRRRRVTCRPEGGGGEEFRDEGADDRGLGHDLIFEDAVTDFDAGHETAGIDLEVPGFAGAIERDDDFFVGDVESAKGDVGTVGPGTGVVGVEGYWGDVSLECLNLSGGDVLLGPIPLLEVSFETPLLATADMLVQCY